MFLPIVSTSNSITFCQKTSILVHHPGLTFCDALFLVTLKEAGNRRAVTTHSSAKVSNSLSSYSFLSNHSRFVSRSSGITDPVLAKEVCEQAGFGQALSLSSKVTHHLKLRGLVLLHRMFSAYQCVPGNVLNIELVSPASHARAPGLSGSVCVQRRE